MKNLLYLTVIIVLSSIVTYACYIKNPMVDKADPIAGQCSNGAGGVSCTSSSGIWTCDGPAGNNHMSLNKQEAINKACGC